MNEMTKELASAVKNLNATAPGIGWNYWDVDGTKTEIRPIPESFGSFMVWGGLVSPIAALALVREAACRGKEIMLWQCCACGDKATSKALGSLVSHGYCARHAAEFRAEALAAAKL
jgi:hypothetical protein